jgi:hypothetical protein
MRIVATARYIDVVAQERRRRGVSDVEGGFETEMPTPPNEGPITGLDDGEDIEVNQLEFPSLTPSPERGQENCPMDESGEIPESLAQIPSSSTWRQMNSAPPNPQASASIPPHYRIPGLSPMVNAQDYPSPFNGTQEDGASEIRSSGIGVGDIGVGNEWMFRPSQPNWS